MNLVAFTHANFNHPVYISRDLVFYIYRSDPNKATHIVSNAGAYIPVIESVEQVKTLLYGPNQTNPKEGNSNG